ncbi:MAG TPA: hypothetical protein PLL30_03890 [Candidatus Krumholzibacteria bacterium]|nr:hypothetical protein [Candidatus Krumholzibacteria bacterium]HPD70913.1 hypothetical protein [Candidatus Krumholzibacteria bacterium]HRY39387.1 hypothetical protein [Candidatus Krumholzibacteria bacterium]
MLILHIVAVAGVLAILWRARSYYLAPLQDRPFHDGYATWRPTGSVGHGLGFAGTAALLLMQLYSVRKRTRLFGRLGRMSRWLSAHVFLGIWGPVLITLHTSFKVQGLVAASYWSMVAVALSGVLGRFLYRQIPRTIAGQELSAADMDLREAELRSELAAHLPAPEAVLAGLDRLAVPPGGPASAGLVWLFRRNLALRRDLDRLLGASGLDRGVERRLIGALARERVLLRRRRVLGFQVQQAFHYWHVVHKPFAGLMFLVMVVHVGVALWLGYRWIF